MVVFGCDNVRRVWCDGEWFFSVVDVVKALTESPTPRQYWGKIKTRELAEIELSPVWVQLKMESSDGKKYMTDCANLKGIFRIIQSIPSKKAEPFKLWLAKVGQERIEEIENPELAQERMKEMYEKKGYSKSWIDKRLRGISVRQDLTDEWKARGIKKSSDFAILTTEISKAAFGLTPSEYKDLKGLERENLRDHMTDLELIFSMLGEASTAELERVRDIEDFEEHKNIASEGGNVARVAREDLERKSGEKVLSSDNYLDTKEREIKKKKKVIIL